MLQMVLSLQIDVVTSFQNSNYNKQALDTFNNLIAANNKHVEA